MSACMRPAVVRHMATQSCTMTTGMRTAAMARVTSLVEQMSQASSRQCHMTPVFIAKIVAKTAMSSVMTVRVRHMSSAKGARLMTRSRTRTRAEDARESRWAVSPESMLWSAQVKL